MARIGAVPGGAEPPWLAGLNPAQRAAVETTEGPLLVLAGAGTGKTRALTARIAHILATGRARPHEILAVTFTNKAAREMKARVAAHLGQAVEGMPWLGTFHSIGVKFLRRHAEMVGLRSNFTILDTDDQLRLLKQLITAEGIDEKRLPARQMAHLIDRWKNRALTPEKLPASEEGAFGGFGRRIYAAYQERLATLNAVDFGDLLVHVVTILQSDADLLERYRRLFRYILVDEYQDTNVAQYLWLRLLAGEGGNICCVGDDDQSIYGWRGAEVGNILRFEKDFPGARIIRLEENYRSSEHILAAADGVIAANRQRLGKTLWTAKKGGEKVRLIGHWDGEEEARWIGEEIEDLQRGTRGLRPYGLDEIAILVRAAHQMRAFEERFVQIGLPYRVIGGPRFYERREIRDALAYFRVTLSPSDDLAFERIVNVPRRGLGEKAMQTLHRRAREENIPLLAAARALVGEGAFSARGRKALKELVEGFDRWRAMAADPQVDHVALAGTILDESGYTAMWQAEKTPEAEGRLENLKELMKALEEFASLGDFLEHVALVSEGEEAEEGEKVSIMTLHAAKGLEFPVVFLPGWEDGLFPNQRALDENGTAALEEERRLAYVGITRAEELCTISFAANRRVFGQWQSALPSRFIEDLPPDHVEVLTPPGLGGVPGGGRPGRAGAAAGTARGAIGDLERRAAESIGRYESPGWKRMQRRGVAAGGRARRPVTIDVAPVSPPVGTRVFHQKFGYGRVVAAEGDRLRVDFEISGEKRVMASYLEWSGGAADSDDIPF